MVWDEEGDTTRFPKDASKSAECGVEGHAGAFDDDDANGEAGVCPRGSYMVRI